MKFGSFISFVMAIYLILEGSQIAPSEFQYSIGVGAILKYSCCLGPIRINSAITSLSKNPLFSADLELNAVLTMRSSFGIRIPIV